MPENDQAPSSEPGPRAATLRHVAASAGVSVSSAARVLRGDTKPSDPALRLRVQDSARALGYVPNVVARNLRSGVPTMVGLVVGNMLEPYYGEIAQAVTERAEQRHKALAIVCNMQRDPQLELKYCRQLWEHRVAGLILSGGLFDQWSARDELAALIAQMTASGVVVVSLGPRGFDVPIFSADNVAVGTGMAAHLVARGHRDVGILMGPAQSEVAQQRLIGATRELARAGVRQSLVHIGDPAEEPAAAASRLAAAHPELTGFIVGSDSLAFEMLQAIRMLGRPEPEAGAIVGIGNTRAPGGRPRALASVDIGLASCAEAALDHIVAVVASGDAPAFARPLPRIV